MTFEDEVEAALNPEVTKKVDYATPLSPENEEFSGAVDELLGLTPYAGTRQTDIWRPIQEMGYGLAQMTNITESLDIASQSGLAAKSSGLDPKTLSEAGLTMAEHPLRDLLHHQITMDPTPALESPIKGWQEGENIFEKIKAISPLAKMWRMGASLRMVPPSPEFMELYDKGQYEFAAEQLQAEKQANVEETFKDFKIDKTSGWVTAGEFGKMILDPTTLLPIGPATNLIKAGKVVNGVKVTSNVVGNSIAGSAALGAVLAGGEVGLAQYTGHGDYMAGIVRWDEVGKAMALGAILTGAMAKLGNVFRLRAHAKIDQGRALETNDVKNLDEAGERARDFIIEDAEEFINSINRKLGLVEVAPRVTDDALIQHPGKKKPRKKKGVPELEEWTNPTIVKKLKEQLKEENAIAQGKVTRDLMDTSRLADSNQRLDVDWVNHEYTGTPYRKSPPAQVGIDKVTLNKPTVSPAKSADDIVQSMAVTKRLAGSYVPLRKITANGFEEFMENTAEQVARIRKETDELGQMVRKSARRAMQKEQQMDHMWVQRKIQREEEVWRKALAQRAEQKAAAQVGKIYDVDKPGLARTEFGPKPDAVETAMEVAWTKAADAQVRAANKAANKLSLTTAPTAKELEAAAALDYKPIKVEAGNYEIMTSRGKTRITKQGRKWLVSKGEGEPTDAHRTLTEAKGAIEHADRARVIQAQNRNHQAGFARAEVMGAIAGAGLGGLVDGDDGGMIWGAAAGFFAPRIGSKLHAAFAADWSSKLPAFTPRMVHSYMAGWNWASPSTVFKSWGVSAQKLGHMLTLARDNMEVTVAGMGADVRKMAADLGLLDKYNRWDKKNDGVMRILQGDVDPRTFPVQIREAAEYIRKNIFERALDDSLAAGLIDKKRHASLKAHARQYGYWPRIYNDDFLSTTKGEQLWIRHMSQQSMDEDTARSLLETVLGQSHKDISKYLAEMKSGTKFRFQPSVAKKLLQTRRRYVASGRSVHMEKTRKLHVKSEEILRPFLVHNPEQAIAEYLQDVYKQIEYAKVFGAKDETALKLLGKIREEHGGKAADMATETYYLAVGDPRSWNIEQQMSQGDFYRAFSQKADAVTTLNLSLAQILNMGQGTINGSVLLSNFQSNPFRVAGMVGKAWMDTNKQTILPGFLRWGDLGRGTEQGRKVAERSGAAFETNIIQYVGEHGNMQHTLTGKNYAGGDWNPVNWVNNPTTFLKVTGFLNVEKFQRDLAANLGFQASKDLLERKVAAEAIGDVKSLKTINKYLHELGFSDNVNPQALLDDLKDPTKENFEMLRAGLKFSNMANFRNVAEELPLNWQSPYAKLFRKFKTFAFHHGKFVKDRIIRPAIEDHNLTPLMAYTGMALGVGSQIADFRELVRGGTPEEREGIMSEIAYGMGTIGAAGLWWDTLYRSSYHESGIVMNLAGPFISHASSLTKGAWASLQNQDLYDFNKAAIGTMVFPGKKAVMERYTRSDSSYASKRRRRRRTLQKRISSLGL